MANTQSDNKLNNNEDMASKAFSALGAQIQKLRRQHGLTLKELGQRSDLSHAFLSQLERGKTTASVVTIQRIAVVLNTTVSSLLATPQRESAVQIYRSSGDPVLQYADHVEDADVHSLGHNGLPLKALEYFGGPRNFGQFFQHPGYEFLYVIHGSIELEVDGQCSRLEAHDAASYPGSKAHRWRVVGQNRPKVLLVVGDACENSTSP